MTWRAFGLPLPQAAPARGHAASTPVDGSARTFVLVYGLFGLGYIVPATFLPAAARSLVADPAIFGWTWPLFGAAACASTIVVARWQAAPRRVAVGGLWVMAAGVLAPAL